MNRRTCVPARQRQHLHVPYQICYHFLKNTKKYRRGDARQNPPEIAGANTPSAVLMVSLMYRRLRFVVWNRSHSKDMNRSAVVVMPKNVQLVEFYNLINIDIPMGQVIKLMFFKLKKYRFKRQHEINRKPVP